MDKTLDKEFTKRVKELMKEENMSNNTLSLLLNISLKSTNDLLNNVSPWRLKYIAKVAEYFGVKTDYLIFGDNDYIPKFNQQRKKEILMSIKDYLVKENKLLIYGRLQSEDFFKELDK